MKTCFKEKNSCIIIDIVKRSIRRDADMNCWFVVAVFVGGDKVQFVHSHS